MEPSSERLAGNPTDMGEAFVTTLRVQALPEIRWYRGQYCSP